MEVWKASVGGVLKAPGGHAGRIGFQATFFIISYSTRAQVARHAGLKKWRQHHGYHLNVLSDPRGSGVRHRDDRRGRFRSRIRIRQEQGLRRCHAGHRTRSGCSLDLPQQRRRRAVLRRRSLGHPLRCDRQPARHHHRRAGRCGDLPGSCAEEPIPALGKPFT